MRLPSAYIRRGGDVDMNESMTPMIDVVFLLLVFFVWTASFQLVEKVMRSELSTEMVEHFFRSLAELYREPDAHIGFLTEYHLTMGQILSVPMMLFGIYLVLRGQKQKS